MRSFLKVDLAEVKANYRAYKSLVGGKKVMAVVKADGYGLGAAEIARTLSSEGCEDFAVATADEGVSLRLAGVSGQVLVLGYTSPLEEKTLLEYDLTQALVSEEHAEVFSAKNLKVQIAINTGMNRFGVHAREVEKCEKVIRSIYQKHRLTGLYTHLSCADDEKERAFTQKQIGLFGSVCERVKDLNPEYIHCQNSAAGLQGFACGNTVRLGIMLYGLKPRGGYVLPEGIKPVFKWLSEVALIRCVKKGERVGYGKGFTAKEDMRVAVVATGYADGLDQRLSGGVVYICGRPAKIVGRICMDVFFADITKIENVKVGDTVEIIGEHVTVGDLARRLNVSDYEVVTRIGRRVDRVYSNEELIN